MCVTSLVLISLLQTAEKKLELYKIATEAELAKRLKKRAKKAASSGSTDIAAMATAEDRVKLVRVIELPARCKSLSVLCRAAPSSETSTASPGRQLELLAALHNNSVAALSLALPLGQQLVIRDQITQPGHRSALIHAQFTSDGAGLFTAALSEAKLWDKTGLRCLFTLSWGVADLLREEPRCGPLGLAAGQRLEASSALLLPGDRHAVIGYRCGAMLLFQLVDGAVLQAVRGHTGGVTALVASSDNKVIRSTSDDKTMLEWRLQYATGNGGKGPLQLAHTGTETDKHAFANGISALSCSPDGLLLALAFLDNKVRTYLVGDTAKRILDLHGHTEPVTCLSMRHDSRQLLSGSSDKTVRAWNMPFGDCKIFRGHRDP